MTISKQLQALPKHTPKRPRCRTARARRPVGLGREEPSAGGREGLAPRVYKPKATVAGRYRNADRLPSMFECTSISTVCPSAFNSCADRSAGAISSTSRTVMPTAPMPSAIFA